MWFRYIAVLCTVATAVAQTRGELDKIASSQGGASSLLFRVNLEEMDTIVYDDFYNDKECKVRRGVPNFLAKLSKGEEVTVAFIGGSLTQANYCYRQQVAGFMQRQYPRVRFTWINAGVSGTGTDLGAFRIKEQVLSQSPDLVIIDFAVNGAYAAGMEGMIRQILRHDPATDICLVYALLGAQTKVYQDGQLPATVQELETLAAYYRIPSVHLGMEIADLEFKQKLLWKGTATEAGNRLLFSNDGVHPLKEGGNLYAAAIARALVKMKTEMQSAEMTIITPLFTGDWDNAGMYYPEDIAVFDEAWRSIPTANSRLRAFEGWFDKVMTANTINAMFSFSFEGDLFGFFDIGGPEMGQLEIWVDGQQINFKKQNVDGLDICKISDEEGKGLLNRFNRFCNNRYRGQYDLIELPFGKHQVRVVISEIQADKTAILGTAQQDDIVSHPEKYNQNVIYLGRILLRGHPITTNKAL
ncbi:SGNH/GDSL hydrolase family protein [Sphingobacterium tabacisoli]|uniref:SGNH/GDSL hydrolase family protein n=1 Tax=Sphingobacterium tabacisoli TaxID=2044855 RepID=A0ABW5L5K7_9SPHI